jgi:uncharacterized membrane protein required for colicin V production
MNIADAAILIFWLVCLVRGIFRGPVNELFSIASALVGLFAAAFFYPYVSRVLSVWMDAGPIRSLTCFFTLFGGMYLLAAVCGVIATYLMHLRRSGWLSRAFGAGLGLLKGMLVVAVVLIPLVAFLPNQSTWIGRSGIIPYENRLSGEMVQVIPSTISDPFSSHIKGYKQLWKRNGDEPETR